MARLTHFIGLLIRGFWAERDAAIAIIGAISLIPLVGIIGIAADSTRGYLAKSQLQQAADAAALAAAQVAGSGQELAEAEKFIAANFSRDTYGAELGDIDVTYNRFNDSITVDATAVVPTSLLKLIKVDEIDIAVSTTVERQVQMLEVALALDVTGSMSGAKLASLKRAANQLLDAVFEGQGNTGNVQVSLVPFSARVNVGRQYRNWLSRAPSNRWRGCLQARSGLAGLDDSPPIPQRFEPAETYDLQVWVRRGSQWVIQTGQYDISCPTELTPLTDNPMRLRQRINQFQASGATRTDFGLLWGWRTISNRWTNLWRGSPDLPSDDERVVKAVVLMTDGQNVPSFSPLNTQQVDRRLATICRNVKSEGIQIFTITFDAPRSLDPLYRQCASSADNFFRSPTRAALEDAFRTIGRELAALRVSR